MNKFVVTIRCHNLIVVWIMKNIYLQILECGHDISELVLATVTRTHGSTPQKPGSSALFGETGLLTGTVGGGVVEGRVHKLAVKALTTKLSGHYKFNLANDISNKEEAICGGEISVLIDANLKNQLAVLEQLKVSMDQRHSGVLITMVTPYAEDCVLINRYWMSETYTPPLPKEFLEKIGPEVHKILSGGDSSDYRELEIGIPGEEPSSVFFLEPVFPPAHLIIAGAGHIGKSLSHLANMLEFEVTVIDDREEYASSENIPDADHIIVNEIGNAMKKITKTRDTYVVIVTRGHKDDAEALKSCIGTELAYIGMIGSKNKIAAMRNSFINNGWATTKQWEEIFAPVGVNIKSRTVEEIAVSVAAQLVLVRNSR